ncbi:MAG: hypothetical protein M3003_10075 [Candidatus Dormibacteraeota bacterium]|nr:hypothetical protein [Candidatus Dormibacteraeota bacterium]MDQ6871971.1 hypothetical protein [Gemmatimonadota bacterium]
MRIRPMLGTLIASVVACSAGCAPTLSTGPSQTTPPTAISTAAATFSVPATFAAVCGTASGRVARTASTNATFLLNSPGRPPLKIASTGNAPIDAVIPGGYVCLLLRPGVPFPIFDGLVGPQMPGFVAEGTFPATAARPAPTGFVLPQTCAFVEPPVVGTDFTTWAVDCGAQANHDARGTLGPALTQQGWSGCAIGLGTMQVKKNGVMLSLQESTLAPGEYPGLTQFARLISPCS